MFDNSFCFLFSKTCFWEYKEKNNFLVFLKSKTCLVKAVFGCCKTFSGKYIFSGKGKCFHVFGCISKNFSENIFWCLEKKKENTNRKTQIRKHKPRRDHDHGAIAISPSSRDRDRRSRDRDPGLDLLLSLARARSLSLSLSHFPEML